MFWVYGTCIFNYSKYTKLCYAFVPVKGIPYNVTVFSTNGRGNGPNISKIAYAEEDGTYYFMCI